MNSETVWELDAPVDNPTESTDSTSLTTDVLYFGNYEPNYQLLSHTSERLGRAPVARTDHIADALAKIAQLRPRRVVIDIEQIGSEFAESVLSAIQQGDHTEMPIPIAIAATNIPCHLKRSGYTAVLSYPLRSVDISHMLKQNH